MLVTEAFKEGADDVALEDPGNHLQVQSLWFGGVAEEEDAVVNGVVRGILAVAGDEERAAEGKADNYGHAHRERSCAKSGGLAGFFYERQMNFVQA
jgi:hypothetical protein